MEEKYWELREAVDRTLDAFCGNRTEENRVAHLQAIDAYEAFCVDTLEKLMEENSDVLKRLKDA
jgi:hypothetical protein